VIARLRALHDEGRVEIQWLTTWCNDADKLLAEPMKLPRGLVVHSKHHRTPGPWWKFRHAREVAEENPDRKIIWIDDDHGYDYESESWLQHNTNVLAIQTDMFVGLTHDHLDRAEEFIDA
jgi:hypothetical protein